MKKKQYGKRTAALVLAGTMALQPVMLPAAENGLWLTAHASSWQGVVNTNNLNVRSGAGTSYDTITSLPTNAKVSVVGQTSGTDGYTWYQIALSDGRNGYVRSDYIRQQTTYSASDASFEQWMNQQGFPESYKNDLRGLHQKYPNWVFRAQKTGLDWNTVIAEESKVGRNLVGKNEKSSWKSIADGAFDWAANTWPGFDGSAWNAASTEIISHYMDPRNFLSEPYIFQFELQSYNPQTQTKDGLQKLIQGTFLDSDVAVPAEGSQVEGGTLIDASEAASLPGAGGAGNRSTGSSGGSGQSAPGGSNTDSGYVSSGPGAVSSGSGQSDDPISIGPGLSSMLGSLFQSAFHFLGGIEAYAGAWKKESEAPLKWVYRNDDGTLLSGGWYWLDGNGDGTAECYYFYPDGAMAYNTTVEGYQVNNDGKWVDASGNVMTKPASEISGPGSGQGSQTSGSTGSSESAGSQSSSQAAGGVQMKRVSYADIIMKAAEKSGVSPYVLASMILQEQGKGTSGSISGSNASYPGYYNYFNIGAYAHDGMGPIEAGLQYASQSGSGGRPWNTIEKSIIGGAQAYGQGYVNAGQDTFYLKKYNVQGSNKYSHQYMTNVPGAAAEGAKISEAYNSEIKATALEFKIPVYENMPETPCPMPTTDGNPNNKLALIAVDGYTLTPTYDMNTSTYSLIVDSSVTQVNISASTIDQNAKVSGTGTVNLNTGMNSFELTVTAQNGSQRKYQLNISRREGGQTSSAGSGNPDSTVTVDPSQPSGSTSSSGTQGTGSAGPGSSGTDSIVSIGSGPVS